MPKPRAPPYSSAPRHRPAGSRDFTTGQCMACGSTVRWPRELNIFKCTICLTVNDRLPIPPEDRRERTQRGRPSAEQPPGLPAAETPPLPASEPLSAERTRAVAAQCLRSFIEAAILLLAHKARPRAPEQANDPHALHRPNNGVAGDPSYRRPGQAAPLSAPISIPRQVSDRNPNPSDPSHRKPSMSTPHSTSYPERRQFAPNVSPQRAPHPNKSASALDEILRRSFSPLESHLTSTFASFHSLNHSFLTRRSASYGKPGSEPTAPRRPTQAPKDPSHNDNSIVDLDAKLLLLGDVAENGLWWTGGQGGIRRERRGSHRSDHDPSPVSQRSPHIDWPELDDCYSAIINCGEAWMDVYNGLLGDNPSPAASGADLADVEAHVLIAQDYAQRMLMKATEAILKRPGRPIKKPSELRFLLIVLANPLLRASYRPFAGRLARPRGAMAGASSGPVPAHRSASEKYSGIIKRVLGLLSNAPQECHGHLVSWLARYPETRFVQVKDLVGSFLAYRLAHTSDKKRDVVRVDIIDGLIPSMAAGSTPASLHAALGHTPGSEKKAKEKQKKALCHDDWQIKAAAQVMALVFAANNNSHSRRSVPGRPAASAGDDAGLARHGVHARGQILPTSDFYTTFLDDSDLLADFEAWEHKRSKFSFCQYPFLLSIWAKIQILEHDARRQMQNKARDAFFDSIMSRRTIEQYLVLNVRRDCLVEDSLKAVSEVIGGGDEEIKKGLRITFRGEEGVDAGGLRKEWFLLLVREVFNPDHGMFIYDEDSQYCYFNPNSFETSDQFFLVGVVFGLAIYNSTILDVALPPFAFRKLLTAAPAPAPNPPSQTRPVMTYALEDLAEYRPRLARGLRQLLEYDGDVESTFCLDFVVDVEKYGSVERVPLCPGGERRAVTGANRREYVDLYVRYLLDTAVSRQFEPFKRGFFTVCGGNALSLFRPEEIDLLVRGSDEPLDIASLRAAAEYANWGTPPTTTASGGNPAEAEPSVRWFWDTFAAADPRDQRKLLLFITGSDRIPAMGAASLSIRIACSGDDCGRYPTAHTCFNSLALARYATRERLDQMLWTAVRESEGFGLK